MGYDDYGKPKRGPSANTIIKQQAASMRNIKRTNAELVFDPGLGRPKKITQVLLILNEFTPTRVPLFSETGFAGGEVLTLNIPSMKNLFVKGRVMACKEITVNQGIVNNKSFQYRVDFEFTFLSDSEREAIQKYYEELTESLLKRSA
jgi:hypothetical protein